MPEPNAPAQSEADAIKERVQKAIDNLKRLKDMSQTSKQSPSGAASTTGNGGTSSGNK